jgi:hypothetical protein
MIEETRPQLLEGEGRILQIPSTSLLVQLSSFQRNGKSPGTAIAGSLIE